MTYSKKVITSVPCGGSEVYSPALSCEDLSDKFLELVRGELK